MAEKQCNLLKNGGGTDKVKLRATVTNSGSQTRTAMLGAIYSDIVAGYNANSKSFIKQAYIVIDDKEKYPIMYANGNIFRFNNSFAQSSELTFFSIEVQSGTYKVYYSALRAGSSQHSDASSSTSWVKIELYY